MSDTPFWERDGVADPKDVEAPEAASDDDQREVITVGGHEFHWTEGVRAEVKLHDDDGNAKGVFYFPYDPDNQPPEEEVLAAADKHWGDLEHMRSVINDDVVELLAQDIRTSGTADAMIKTIAEGMGDGLKIKVSPSDEETPEELAEMEIVAREAERLVNENIAKIVEAVAEVPNYNNSGEDFWHSFARNILAHAIIWARDQTREDLGATYETMNEDEFETLVLNAYRDGPHVTQAMLTLWQTGVSELANLVAVVMEAKDDPDDTPAFLDTLMDAARKRLGLVKPAGDNASAPAFNADGYGHVDNSIVPVSARLAMVSKWTGPKTEHPEFRFTSDAGQAVYAPSMKMFPLAADAWRAVETLDDAHVDTLDYILAKSLANKAARTRDEYGSFTITREDILDARGIAKHIKGGHKPENLAEVVEHIAHLSQLMVRANVTGYTKPQKGKRGKKETLTVEAPLILIAQTLYRKAFDGEQVPIAWHLRPGDWAIEMERFTPQLATMMQGILKLHARRDAHAKRIGRYLVYQYRVRATQKSWAQPYRIETLLAGAGIEVDRGNPGRFRQRIESALATLANSVEMDDGPVCIASWSYPNPIAATGRGWFDRWLASGIIIMPPRTLMEERYGKIGARSQRPRKLASRQT